MTHPPSAEQHELIDLDARIQWWRRHHVVPCQGSSPMHPFEAVPGYERWFRDRDVLEIGPGEGRQTARLLPLARTYAVADIVPEVLEHPMFAASARHLIREYETADLGRQFDVVSFWYVIHHVRTDEARSFLTFAARHTRPGGAIFFNIPSPASAASLLALGPGDGMKTTLHRIDDLREILHDLRCELLVDREQHFSSHIMLFAKRA